MFGYMPLWVLVTLAVVSMNGHLLADAASDSLRILRRPGDSTRNKRFSTNVETDKKENCGKILIVIVDHAEVRRLQKLSTVLTKPNIYAVKVGSRPFPLPHALKGPSQLSGRISKLEDIDKYAKKVFGLPCKDIKQPSKILKKALKKKMKSLKKTIALPSRRIEHAQLLKPAGIVFILDGFNPKEQFIASRKKLKRLVSTISVSKSFIITIIMYLDDQLRVYKIDGKKEVDSIIDVIMKTPFVKSKIANPLKILKKVKEVSRGRKVKIVPVGKLSKPKKTQLLLVDKLRELIEEIEGDGAGFEFLEDPLAVPEFWMKMTRTKRVKPIKELLSVMAVESAKYLSIKFVNVGNKQLVYVPMIHGKCARGTKKALDKKMKNMCLVTDPAAASLELKAAGKLGFKIGDLKTEIVGAAYEIHFDYEDGHVIFYCASGGVCPRGSVKAKRKHFCKVLAGARNREFVLKALHNMGLASLTIEMLMPQHAAMIRSRYMDATEYILEFHHEGHDVIFTKPPHGVCPKGSVNAKRKNFCRVKAGSKNRSLVFNKLVELGFGDSLTIAMLMPMRTDLYHESVAATEYELEFKHFESRVYFTKLGDRCLKGSKQVKLYNKIMCEVIPGEANIELLLSQFGRMYLDRPVTREQLIPHPPEEQILFADGEISFSVNPDRVSPVFGSCPKGTKRFDKKWCNIVDKKMLNNTMHRLIPGFDVDHYLNQLRRYHKTKKN